MYTICLGINKLGISKSLLSYLEYDLEEFCVEAIKYRSISLEYEMSYYSVCFPP